MFLSFEIRISFTAAYAAGNPESFSKSADADATLVTVEIIFSSIVSAFFKNFTCSQKYEFGSYKTRALNPQFLS